MTWKKLFFDTSNLCFYIDYDVKLWKLTKSSLHYLSIFLNEWTWKVVAVKVISCCVQIFLIGKILYMAMKKREKEFP